MAIDSREIIRETEKRLRNCYHTTLAEAGAVQLHNALSGAVMDAVAENWYESRKKHMEGRRAYYFSAEYLIGRMVFNNLFNLGILDEVRGLLKEKGADLYLLEDIEDAALGNGGLGRLAACFLESAATRGIPLDGYGLRYRAGLFKQTFSDGLQCETAEDWQRFGDPWSVRRDDLAVTVEFAGDQVLAVPYDMPVIGYKTENTGLLRLWQSEPAEAFNYGLFNDQCYDLALKGKNEAENITRVLYPNDSAEAGKRLRFRQQYFLASASLKDILRRHKAKYGAEFSGFAAENAIQLNDTHPVVAVPELIRLLGKEGLGFEEALMVAKDTFSYTNHTVMAEALEKWDMDLVAGEAPEIAEIIIKIDGELAEEQKDRGVPEDAAAGMRIVDTDGCVHMADLAVYASAHVNGVAKIHTEILKESLFKDWFCLYPGRFTNVTNGVTQRRWLGLCNPELSAMLRERVTGDFMRDLSAVGELKAKIDSSAIGEFNRIKRIKKEQLSRILLEREGAAVPPDFLFDVQVKRLHEYKRQLLNAFSILDTYFALKDGEMGDFTPTAFIFGAKAAPGYTRAKAVMKFINEIAKLIRSDVKMQDLLQVVFVQNYDCSYAEHIIPAADISEQISTAGTEASGTGNMKLMLNGAVTLGTYDGANVEIVEAAGEENNYIFGARVEDIARIGELYDPMALYSESPRIRRAVDALKDGTLDDGGTGWFKELYNALLTGAEWHKPDHYYLLYDMLPYFTAKRQANADYANRMLFGRKCLENVAAAGRFSSDRAVEEYARDIWRLD
jgi:starch phosphorylase